MPMAARERILASIRRRQGRGGGKPAEVEQEILDTYLRARPRGPLPDVGADLVGRFRARAEAGASTTERVAGLADVPAAAARYLEALNLPKSGCVWPALAGLAWSAAGVSLEPRAAKGDDGIGVTGVYCALAETGTLMLVSGPQTPGSVSLLPETHIAVVPVASIVPCMEDGWERLRAEQRSLPRAVNFISGPSRTADIEQTLILGAHGPYRVHIILVG
jgi:L-lactate dehydrogenase complex protein LldG